MLLIPSQNADQTQLEGDKVSEAKINDVKGKTIIEGLQGINAYLAMISSRLEMLLLSDLPEYIMADLVNVYQAEEEASQIVRSLKIYCHKNI